MTCPACGNWIEITDLSGPYVIRTCLSCGSKFNLREPGKNGHGIRIKKGDQFVFPKNSIKISANPLKGTGQLTKYGLDWFAKEIFINDLRREEQIHGILTDTESECDEILGASKILKDLDLDSEKDAEEVFERLKSNQTSAEWWAFLTGTFNAIVKDAVEENNSQKAAWAMRASEKCRAMYIFKNNLEEVVWMGHSARRIVDVIRKWHSNKTNNKEEFWQQIFLENPYVLNQLFSVPVVFIKDKAYVGGMKVDRQDSKFVDYLYVTESSSDAVLVELKTPVTKLLGAKYRGIHKPSTELSGALVQTLDYRREISKNIKNITDGVEYSLEFFSPRAILIIGNSEVELDTELKRKSFEIYRTSFKDIEIVTYNEIFKKAETLATLFNLVWKKDEAKQ